MERKNKFFIVFFAVILLGITIGAVSYVLLNEEGTEKNQNEIGQIIEKISINEANEMINDNSNFTIIDVRTPNEYGDDRLIDTINIDFYGETFREELNKLDKSCLLIVCYQLIDYPPLRLVFE